MTVQVRSLLRKVILDSPAADGWQDQALLVPVGATDQQVLGWAEGFLSPEAVDELREIIRLQAGGDDAT